MRGAAGRIGVLRVTSWIVFCAIALASGHVAAQTPEDRARLSGHGLPPPVERPSHSPAQPRPPWFAAPARDTYRVTLRWDSTFHVDDVSSRVTWANTLSVQADLSTVVLRTAVPLAYLSALRFSGDQAELGDASLEALANVELGPEHRLLIGGGVALPTATDPSGHCRDAGGLSFYCPYGGTERAQAWAMGFRNPAAWTDHALTLTPSLEYTLGVPWFLLNVVAQVPIFFPTDSSYGGSIAHAHGDVDVLLSLEAYAALRIVDVVDVGAGFAGLASPSSWATCSHCATLPDSIAALTVFVRTDPTLASPVGGGAELVYDLTEGYAWWVGTLDPIWAIRLFVEGRIDVSTRTPEFAD